MLQTELRSLALTDEISGLYNSRGFLCLTERQLKRVRRSGRDILLFFINVDCMKHINDSVGHSEDDLALTCTAKILVNTFRDLDILARLGGDEFAALAIEASDHSEAIIIARLRENLETVNAQKPRYPLSLSVGVVRFSSRTTRSIAELMLQVDRAMYQAKRNHRRSGSPDAFLPRPLSRKPQPALSLDRLEKEPGLGKRDSS